MGLNIKRSDFAKNVLVLFSGTFISQVIPFLVLPVLQKFYYSPSDFGILVVFVTFSELFANISSLKLEFGIVLQKRLKDAVNLMYGAFRVSIVTTLISFVIVLFFKKKIAESFSTPEIENLLFLVPLYVLFFSTNNIMSYWNNRKSAFKIISYSKIVQTSSAELSKILIGIINISSGLIIGRIIGFAFSSIYYVSKFIKTDVKSLKLLNSNMSNKVVRNNTNFVFYTTPSVFISSLINFVYINLFLYYFGSQVVGVLGVSTTYISAAYGVISVSFSQVFYSKINSLNTKKELLDIYIKFAKRLFIFSSIPLIFIYVIPTTFVTTLLGGKWAELLPIARIMVIWLSFWFVSSSLSFIYMRLGKQKVMLFYDLLHLLVILIGFFGAKMINPSFTSVLWGFTIAKAGFYIFIIFLTIRFIKNCDESRL
jgi:lipopolysaccharide exporter